MTVESSRMQMPTAATNNPIMNIQNEIQKGVNKSETNPNTAASIGKQVLASTQVPQVQNPQQVISGQLSKGYLDIKI